MQIEAYYKRKEALELALQFAERIEDCTPDDVLDFADKFHYFLTNEGEKPTLYKDSRSVIPFNRDETSDGKITE